MVEKINLCTGCANLIKWTCVNDKQPKRQKEEYLRLLSVFHLLTQFNNNKKRFFFFLVPKYPNFCYIADSKRHLLQRDKSEFMCFNQGGAIFSRNSKPLKRWWSKKMPLVTGVNKVVCVSLHTNTFGKGMNLSLLSPGCVLNKILQCPYKNLLFIYLGRNISFTGSPSRLGL